MVDDAALLSRIEDAGLNASAPTQQRWLDGWLVRYSPGKAKRARCIHAVAAGRLPLDQKLRLAREVFDAAGLPVLFRMTPYTQPADLDARLADLGFTKMDDTRVMVCAALPGSAAVLLPPGTVWRQFDAAAYAETVGALRGSPPEQRRAHAERLTHSPVRYRGFGICGEGDGAVLACGQFARESELVGLYDVHTRDDVRGQGLATVLCERMLSVSASEGGKTAYLQVDAVNAPARHVYRKMGFVDAYAYHYRQAPAG